MKIDTEQLQKLLKKIVLRADSGRCGSFAIALKRFLGEGELFACESLENEGQFAHVVLRWENYFWDGNGKIAERVVKLWSIQGPLRKQLIPKQEINDILPRITIQPVSENQIYEGTASGSEDLTREYYDALCESFKSMVD